MQDLKVGLRLSTGFVVMLIVCQAVAENVPLQRLVNNSRQAAASAHTLHAKTLHARPLDQVGSSGGNRIATTIAGLTLAPYGLGGPATSADLESSTGVAFDQAGNMYIAVASQVLEVNATTGIISVFAGTGQPGYTPDGQFAVNTQFSYINGIAFDRAGNLYIADGSNGVIRQVNVATGIVTTVAGNKSYGYAGDGGPATKAELDNSSGIAVDASGNLYIADSGNNVIRRVAASTGIITSVAGVPHQSGYSGDSGPATSAQLAYPEAVVVDSNGNLYIGDEDNDVVRKVTAGGTISTYAGNENYGNSGDNGAATAAQLDGVQYLALDAAGNLYISTYTDVRMVNASTGVITTVAGTGATAATSPAAPQRSCSVSPAQHLPLPVRLQFRPQTGSRSQTSTETKSRTCSCGTDQISLSAWGTEMEPLAHPPSPRYRTRSLEARLNRMPQVTSTQTESSTWSWRAESQLGQQTQWTPSLCLPETAMERSISQPQLRYQPRQHRTAAR